ncbi:fungal-specific transcription factor domain-containing protein [Lipomyces kononenkoae]|uniref:Fungal-specific transcription factor domain-containing protein n=1 Tax=Lipomyces kononenkoae TaxID=34357 RepID=A0ACC3STB4_LIPKO
MDSDEVSIATGESPFPGSHEEEVNAEECQEQTPSSDSKRPTSCELCKTRKVRCDRAEPSCGWCTRNGRVCVYKGRQKPGFRAGYVRELENKINRLEAILQALGRQVENHISDHESSRRASESPLVDERIPSQQRFHRTSELMSVRSMTNTPEAAQSDLPPTDLLYSLVDLYFKHVNPWCPILDRKVTLMRFFGSSVADDADAVVLYAIVATALRFSQDPSLTPELRKRYLNIAKDKVLLRSLQSPSIPSLQALVILAWDFLGSSDGPQNANILAIIVRTVQQLKLHVESSLSLSPAVRAAASPGRLRDSILPPPASWIDDEGRRRLFWMIYIIERYTAVATLGDCVLRDSDIDRSLPCQYDLFSKNQPVETRWYCGPGRSKMLTNRPENLGSFSYHCEVVRTLSRVQTFLQTPVDICSLAEVESWQTTYCELDDELNDWLGHLPDDYSKVSQLCHSDPTSKMSNWIMLHAAFVTSVVRLHSCAAYPSVRSHIFTPSLQASQRCLTAVESLREIAQDVFNTGMLPLLGPHFAFALYVAARLLLVHTASRGSDYALDPTCEFFIFMLQQIGQYWTIARHYAHLLDQVWKRSRLGSPDGTRRASKALAMMRRRAYQIHLSASHRPSSSKPVTSVSVEDLEYLEVFEFFNYPRLPATVACNASLYGSLSNMDGVSVENDSSLLTTNFDVGWSYGGS